MRTYNVGEFREKLAIALDYAEKETVLVCRNGKEYEIRLRQPRTGSGLDVPGITPKKQPTLDSLLEDIQAGRERR